MELTIDKNQVYDSVAMHVSIVGRDLKDANGVSLYDKVRIQDRDKDVLDLFWADAFGDLIEKLGDFITSSADNKLALAEDRRMSEASLTKLDDAITGYMVYSMTANWMKLKAVEYAPVYEGKAEASLASVMARIRVKKEPTLKKYNG